MQAIAAFRQDFISAQSRCHMLEAEVALFLPRAGQTHLAPPGPGGGGPDGGGGGGDGNGGAPAVGTCIKCQSGRLLVSSASPAALAAAAAAGAGGQPPLQHTLCCSSHPVCNHKLLLPRAVHSVEVLPQQCGRCVHGVVQLVRLGLRLHLLPPGMFLEPVYDGCVMCDARIQGLIQACGVVRAPRAGGRQQQAQGQGQGQGQQRHGTAAAPAAVAPEAAAPAAAAVRARGGPAAAAGGGGYNPYSSADGGAAGGFDAAPGGYNPYGPAAGGGGGDAGGTGARGGGGRGRGRGVGTAAGGARGGRTTGTKRPRQEADSEGQPGRSAAGRGRGRGAAGSGGVPLCPVHGQPVLASSARNGDNAGRVYYKCALVGRLLCGGRCGAAAALLAAVQVPLPELLQGGGGGKAPPAAADAGRLSTEASRRLPQADGNCMKFVWADQFDAGSAAAMAARAGGGAGGRGGRGGGRAGGGGGGGGARFASSTGEGDRNTCYKCGQPGHWASSCPNAG
jgi:hypothetical protein